MKTLLVLVFLFASTTGYSQDAEPSEEAVTPPVETESKSESSRLPPNLSEEFHKLKPEVDEASEAGKANYSEMFVGLFAVLGLIMLLAWAAKRFSVTGITANQTLKLQSVLSLGPKEKIAIVEVEGKRLLIGVTPQHINMLYELDESEALDTAEDAISKGSFATQIKKALTQGSFGEDSKTS